MTRRPIRIAGASGSASDRRHAILSLVSNHPHDPVDVIIGDWMSEANMTARAWSVSQNAGSADGVGYEPSFLEALIPALPLLAKHGIKLISNAGASDVAGLFNVVKDLVRQAGVSLNVAWISGDDVLPQLNAALESGSDFTNLHTGESLSIWRKSFNPVGAQAYLGGMGIATALADGADIILCGRVADASPVIGAAAWWHGWGRTEFSKLANALVAGHLIECSSYVCGGNFSGFKTLPAESLIDIGFPIAEISAAGEVVITKQRRSGGAVTIETVTAQLLYEIQGPWYFNADVTAVLDGVWFEHLSVDRVALRGVQGAPPPATTKVGVSAEGGWQAEAHYFFVGLDIPAKATMMEAQIRRLLKPEAFTKLEFSVNGTPATDPRNQSAATVDFRIFAQSRHEADLAPARFLKPVLDTMMQAAPGATAHLDFRQGFPKRVFEYFVTLLPQAAIQHKAHMHNGSVIDIASPTETRLWPRQQPGAPATDNPVPLENFGPTERGPLGWIVHGRSGDKGSDANVGLFVRHRDEWDWLRTLVSVDKMKELLADEYSGHQIDRFELPHVRAVHFLLHEHLDRGVSCTSSCDFLGKNVAEFVRARYVDVPVKFLARGKL